MDELTQLANMYDTDKGTMHFDRHNYTRIYSALFQELRYRPIRLLEIGLLHAHDAGWIVPRNYKGTAKAIKAPSLNMWSKYFPKGQIFGLDINDFSGVSVERCRIFRGDSSSRHDLGKLIKETGGDFDIIIDDASHSSHHQQIALGALFPYLRYGGAYIIEDLHWQPKELEIERVSKTRTLLRRFSMLGVFESEFLTTDEQNYVEKETHSVQLYDSLGVGNPLVTCDALGVIIKRKKNRDTL